MSWTRELPAEPGEYWFSSDHWCDGDALFCRVFRDNDDDLACLLFGRGEVVKLTDMEWPAYWMKADIPRAVFQ